MNCKWDFKITASVEREMIHVGIACMLCPGRARRNHPNWRPGSVLVNSWHSEKDCCVMVPLHVLRVGRTLILNTNVMWFIISEARSDMFIEVKIHMVCWAVIPFTPTGGCQFRRNIPSLSSWFSWNVGTYLPDCMMWTDVTLCIKPFVGITLSHDGQRSGWWRFRTDLCLPPPVFMGSDCIIAPLWALPVVWSRHIFGFWRPLPYNNWIKKVMLFRIFLHN